MRKILGFRRVTHAPSTSRACEKQRCLLTFCPSTAIFSKRTLTHATGVLRFVASQFEYRFLRQVILGGLMRGIIASLYLACATIAAIVTGTPAQAYHAPVEQIKVALGDPINRSRDIAYETDLYCLALAVYFEGGSTDETEEASAISPMSWSSAPKPTGRSGAATRSATWFSTSAARSASSRSPALRSKSARRAAARPGAIRWRSRATRSRAAAGSRTGCCAIT